MNYNIHIISLAGDVERRESLKESLRRSDCRNYRVIDAVDGRAMTAIDYFRGSRNCNFWFNRRQHLTPSELGCFLSHRKSYEEFLVCEDAEWLIVLEDDVELKESFNSFLKIGESLLDKRSIYILGGQNGLRSFRRVILGRRESNGGAAVLFGTHRWVYRTCSYAIHRSMVASVLQLLNKGAFVIDNWGYLIANSSVNRMLYRDDVNHPEDLSSSRIEGERGL